MNNQSEVLAQLPVALHEVHQRIMTQDEATVQQYEQQSVGLMAGPEVLDQVRAELNGVWPFEVVAHRRLKKLWVIADAAADQLTVVADYEDGQQDAVTLNGLSTDPNQADFVQLFATAVSRGPGGALTIDTRFDPSQPAAAAHFKAALQQQTKSALRAPTCAFSIGY